MSMLAPSHLEPSELGTKEYWDSAYATELDNQAADPADTGHVWFSESDAEGRVVAYLDRLEDDEAGSGSSGGIIIGGRAATTFLDLGTGNGSMLRALRDDGWTADMLGVDYSAASVALARRAAAGVEEEEEEEGEGEGEGEVVAAAATEQGELGVEGEGQRRGEGAPPPPLRFEVWDLIRGEYEPWIWARSAADKASSAPSASSEPQAGVAGEAGTRRPWDVLLDKGTFDAISLSDERDGHGRRIVETYRERIKPLIARGNGMLLITSCNWTEEELVRWFVLPEEAGHEADGGFALHGKVKYPTFRFGGKEGQAISSVCFKRT